MRYSEILGLRWENVDLEKRQITIKAESSKSRKRRVIPVNEALFVEMEKLRKLNGGTSDFVFLYEDPKTGKPRSVKTVRGSFVMACNRAGIKGLRFHDLRHTVGSRLISKGADPVSVKNILGHANLKTTEIYLHSSLKQMREAVDMLDEKPSVNARNVEKLLLICNAEKGERKKKLVN
ncbi:MAG: tyrosine-type recombinase/integrase [Candidatus Aminicenantales bacterium]